MSLKRRVVVTGMGTLTPIGIGVEEFWDAMLKGNSGAAPITYFDTSAYDTHFGCELKNFRPMDYLDRKSAQRMDPFAQYAVVSSDMAIADSGLSAKECDPDRIGVVYGSGIGGMITYDAQFKNHADRGPRGVSPFFIPMLIPDIAAGNISIRHGFKGPNYATVSACATASHAIGDAFRIIQYGDADAMLCGGSEAPITPMGLAGFNSMRALSQRNDAPEKASRPFDAGRDGFVAAEGSAMLVLESLEHARARGARILAEIVGFASCNDGYHLVAPSPDGEGAVRTMRWALKDAGLQPEEVDYINAHGTSTPLNDVSETLAIKAVFGEHAYRVPISSTKSMIGHAMGASGALESLVCVMTLQTGIIHPTINQEQPDPQCDLDYVPNKARRANVRTILKNSFGFGGQNACLVFRRFEE